MRHFRITLLLLSLALPDRFFPFLFCVGGKKGLGTWSVVVCVSSPAKSWGENFGRSTPTFKCKEHAAFGHLTRTFIVQGMLITCVSEAMNQV